MLNIKHVQKKFYKNVDRRIIVQFLENTQPYTQQMNLFVNTLLVNKTIQI